MRIGVNLQDAAAENRFNGNLTQAQQEFNPVFLLYVKEKMKKV